MYGLKHVFQAWISEYIYVRMLLLVDVVLECITLGLEFSLPHLAAARSMTTEDGGGLTPPLELVFDGCRCISSLTTQTGLRLVDVSKYRIDHAQGVQPLLERLVVGSEWDASLGAGTRLVGIGTHIPRSAHRSHPRKSTSKKRSRRSPGVATVATVLAAPLACRAGRQNCSLQRRLVRVQDKIREKADIIDERRRAEGCVQPVSALRALYEKACAPSSTVCSFCMSSVPKCM